MSITEEFKVKISETSWVFVSAGQNEYRHLLDIAWAVESLRSRGVPDANISIFQDDPNYKSHLDAFKISGLVHDLKDFEKAELSVASSGVCFFVFAGHGDISGIVSEDSGVKLSPVNIFKRARSVVGAKRCILIMGQCYGGIFEALDASIEKPELGVIAAAELNSSISNMIPFSLRGIVFKNHSSEKIEPWHTNIFLLHFFNWIRTPMDVDGDVRHTLLDAYKYAGAMTNEDFAEARLRQSLDLSGELGLAKEKLQKHLAKNPALTEIDLISVSETIRKLTTGLHTYSDPWILHAHLIRGTEFI